MDWLYQISSQVDWSLLSRLLIAGLLGSIVGFERERSRKVAGLRTHALVSIGAALFTIISLEAFRLFPSVNGVQGYDYHLVANIVVGIGFIGAGTILRREDKVEGTTTAASLWVVSAIGIASGFGLFKEAIATTIIVYIVLSFLWIFEKYFARAYRYKKTGLYEELNNQEHSNEVNNK